MPTPIELLREAADDLESLVLPVGADFYMNSWGQHPPGGRPILDNLCGTSACAAGWLSLMPKWRRRGFTSHWVGKADYGWSLRSGTKDDVFYWDDIAIDVFGHDLGNEVYSVFIQTDLTRGQVVARFRSIAAAKELQNGD